MFYELLTGRRPHRARQMRELLDEITGGQVRPPRQLDHTIPEELERICLNALVQRAADRYTTAFDLADDLRQLQARYVQCMERARSDTIRAKLLEWRAIWLAQTQGPIPESLDFLNRAVVLNPDDLTAQRNLRRLEERLSQPQSANGAWTIDDFPASDEALTFLADPDQARVAA